jgi:hypothetical protein
MVGGEIVIGPARGAIGGNLVQAGRVLGFLRLDNLEIRAPQGESRQCLPDFETPASRLRA